MDQQWARQPAVRGINLSKYVNRQTQDRGRSPIFCVLRAVLWQVPGRTHQTEMVYQGNPEGKLCSKTGAS